MFGKHAALRELQADEGASDLLRAVELSLDQIRLARETFWFRFGTTPLSHVVAALQAAGDRDVV
jgi:hypothetical protein